MKAETLKKILSQYITPKRVDDGSDNQVMTVREALRHLNILQTVRGAGQSQVIQIDPANARKIASVLNDLAAVADVEQSNLRIREMKNGT